MEFAVKVCSPNKQRSACLVVAVYETAKLSRSAQIINEATDQHIADIVKKGDIKGKLGQTLLLHNIPGALVDRVLLVGCGKDKDISDVAFRKIASATILAIKSTTATDAIVHLTELKVKGRDIAWKIQQLCIINQAAFYQSNTLKNNSDTTKITLKKITYAVDNRNNLPRAEQAMHQGSAIATGITLCKTLSDLPGNVCTPTYLAEQAQALASQYKSVKVTITDEREMERMGMGALLSVSRGSRQEAKLITIHYKGGNKTAKPIVLVGKGLTFDAGGISLKPGQGMDEMKYDMCGGASVLGTLKTIAELDLPVNVIGIIPSSENLPDGNANKPGDIVKSLSGTTIEILNTDAEGRLLLCDALTYAEKFDPEFVIDIATLTGACVVALGKHASGLFSNYPPLVKALDKSGLETGDRVWEMPIWDEYQDQLKSNFADVANIGGRDAGSITAACFLARFTKKFQWAHLDIAGTAWNSGSDKGATGRPVHLLSQFVINRCHE